MIVQDFGCGMSQEAISKLFIDFNKIEENASLNRNGVGLGLSICKLLIEQMAGSVRVESKLGEGTSFTISFLTTCKIYENLLHLNMPSICNEASIELSSSHHSLLLASINEDSGPYFNILSSDEDGNNLQEDNTKPTMLFANDNMFLLNAYAKIIRTYFTVFKAENGLEAYEILKDKPRHFFDAVMLDNHMPIMDGFQAGKKISEYLKSTNLVSIVSVN